jgi:nucleoside-diphosphate-sugar epimerase
VKILVTGAGGFVGDAVVRRLAAAGHEVTGTFRAPVADRVWMETAVVGDLEATADFRPLTDGMDAVVHLAARVHMMRETAADPLGAYRRANTDVTRRLAEAAATTGAARFVFLSSVKVNGERTTARPFDEDDAPAPQDPYGVSKMEAEQALPGQAGTTSLRTPLIYGPGVKANFRALMKICDTALPLPLDGIRHNRRSLLYLGNLTHAIERILTAERTPDGVFLLSDGEDLSTAELVRRLRFSLNRKAVPFPIPAGALRTIASLAGKSAAADRLCGSLQVDSRRFRDAFGWTPPFTVGQGLAATAARYRASS